VQRQEMVEVVAGEGVDADHADPDGCGHAYIIYDIPANAKRHQRRQRPWLVDLPVVWYLTR
jgi:hypothetical protein